MKGAAMGIAESIPGVSGGTIAFITGIYDRLIFAIKAFDPKLIGIARKDGFGAVYKTVDGNFLVSLLVGMVFGLILGVFGVAYFLEYYPPVVWAFFFGLIVASVIYIGRQIEGWNIQRTVFLLLGAVIAYAITQLPLGEANSSLWFVFLCGAVAVSALMLPGISGSFILLILGMYQYILHDTFKEGVLSEHDPQALIIMITFGLGMLLGLASFSRVLSWAFKNYRQTTLAMLTGFMIGALHKVWPWRIPKTIMLEDGSILPFELGLEVDKVIQEANVLPARYASELLMSPYLVASIISLVVGFVGVFYLEKLGSEKV